MRRVPPAKKPMFQLSQDLFGLDLFSLLILASGFLLIAPSRIKNALKYIMDLFELQPPQQKGIEDHENCRGSI
jgi:hypothetical protein